ncbi:MAG: TetR/AcrR family transcriptional regulator [Alphaproteobacteria bacterium]
MPYAPEHRQRTRKRILRAARREMNRKGYGEASIDSIMAEAGLTRGGFYGHFKGKEDLFVEVLADLADTPVEMNRRMRFTGLDDFVERYLSPAHRDLVEEGCSVPPLSPEIARSGEKVKSAFSDYVATISQRLGGLIERRDCREEDDQATDRALAALTACVGGLVLSRAVNDPALSDRILAAAKRAASRGGAAE